MPKSTSTTKRPSRAIARRDPKTGRALPVPYDPDLHPLTAAALTARGATLDVVAKALKISPRLLDKWIKAYPEMKAAVEVGRDHLNDDVEGALYKRAVGYELEKVKIIALRKADGTETTARIEKLKEHIPADPACIFFWLANRRPERWKNPRHEMVGRDGGPIEVVTLTEQERIRRTAALFAAGDAGEAPAAGQPAAGTGDVPTDVPG